MQGYYHTQTHITKIQEKPATVTLVYNRSTWENWGLGSCEFGANIGYIVNIRLVRDTLKDLISKRPFREP